MKKLLTIALLVGVVHEAVATTGYWANNSTDLQSGLTASNWKNTNAGGAVLTEPPIKSGDVMIFPAINNVYREVQLTGNGTQIVYNNRITGGYYWSLVFDRSNKDTYSDDTYTNEVSNINGFTGIWKFIGGKNKIKVMATSGEQLFTRVQVSGAFPVEVVNEDTIARATSVEALQNSGAIRKSGIGVLQLDEIVGGDKLSLDIDEGQVTVLGRPSSFIADDHTALQKAAIRLDASRADTFETQVDEETGKTYVTKWNDANGREDVFAEHFEHENLLPPFISDEKSPTGLALMDFGDNDLGASGAVTQSIMRLYKRFTNVREVFFVAMMSPRGSVIGDETNTAFVHGGLEGYAFENGDALTANGGYVKFNAHKRVVPSELIESKNRIPQPIDTLSPKAKSLFLADIKPGSAQSVHFLASDRLKTEEGDGTGGVKIAEILIYTETLSDTEREQVNEYLANKWLSSRADTIDLKVVRGVEGASLNVPGDRVVAVDSLIVEGGFTKKGAGILKVGRAYPARSLITVEEGEVWFDPVVETTTVDEPAANPDVWLDAEAENCFEVTASKVTKWVDKRYVGVSSPARYAQRLNFDQITAYPSVDTTTLPDHTVLNFGSGSAFAIPDKDPSNNSIRQRELFAVVRFETDNYAKQGVVFGEGYRTDRYLSGKYYKFANYPCSLSYMAGGVFTVNGEPVRPFDEVGNTFEAGNWYVVSESLTGSWAMNRLASNGPRSQVGGICYGEYITYNRELTDAERRQTVAYLMKRWLNKEHPETLFPENGETIKFTGDAIIGCETNLTLTSVTGEGYLIKKGEGEATISSALTDDLDSISVNGGTLSIVKPTSMPDDSQFHFDMSDMASYVDYEVDTSGNTNVAKMIDVRTNGVAAVYQQQIGTGYNSFKLTKPQVISVNCASDGKTRTMIDCFNRVTRGGSAKAGGLLIQKSNGAEFTEKSREFYAVFADNVKNNGYIQPWGLPTSLANSDELQRGLNGILFRDNLVPETVLYGKIFVDGEPSTYDAYVSGDNNELHVVGVCPTSEYLGSVTFPVGAICVKSSSYGGGLRFGEYLAFNRELTDKERVYLNRHLAYKWLGSGEDAIWTNEITRLTVRNGATLTTSGGGMFYCTEIHSAGGTFNVPRIMGVNTLTYEFDEKSHLLPCLNFNGVFQQGNAAEFSVNVTGVGVKPRSGTHAIVIAQSLENVNLSKWKLKGDLDERRRYYFTRTDNVIFLNVMTSGGTVTLR